MADLKQSFDFLVDLSFNNDRIWFNNNKDKYQNALAEFEGFINKLILNIKEFDDSVDVSNAKECMFRIYKDVRFSANKDPYKTNFGAFVVKGGRKSPFAGYYIHFEPDKSFVGGGIYMPMPDVLLKLRTHVLNNSEEFKKIIFNKKFTDTFGSLMDEKLKTAPKGFPKDHPDINLAYYKSYAIGHEIDNEDWFDESINDKIIDIFKTQFKFNRFLNFALK